MTSSYRPELHEVPLKEGKCLIRFIRCNCGMKDFCRMFGKKPDCDKVVPDYQEGYPA